MTTSPSDEPATGDQETAQAATSGTGAATAEDVAGPALAVILEDVSKSYDSKIAVDDVSLRVPRGSVFGLRGPNGAGKTTMLKIVATLIKADQGNIEILGHELQSAVRDVRPRLGYMPDQFGVFRGLTCEEYLQFFGRAHGFSREGLAERIEAVLDLTELGRVREEMTAALSTGMKQRLSLAKTLLHDPDVLILDEPASGLDPRARIEIRSLLDELGRMGKTILISSHILADLEEICTDVAIMEEGRVVWSGSLGGVRELERGHLDAVVRVASADVDRAQEVLRSLAAVHETATSTEGRIDATIDTGRGNDVLRALVDADIEVLHFKLEHIDLEALFLRRTRGIVS